MAEFPIILAECLICDSRRVEPSDMVDIYLDPEKFPDAESPIRAVVLDVRQPEPPESLIGKVALDVQVADEDMPAGVTELDPDDIDYVQCVDCCIRNTERIETLEARIIGTQETLVNIFPPFIPQSFTVTLFGAPLATITYGGELGGFPYWENGGGTIRMRRDGEAWILITPGVTYSQVGGPVNLPWMLPTTALWSYTSGPSTLFAPVGYTNYIGSTTPVYPSEYSTDYSDIDLIFAKSLDDTLWFWNGETWRPIFELIEWDPADAIPTAKDGPFIITTASGTVNAKQTWPGDIFWRQPYGTSPGVIRIGVNGTFESVGVTTNTIQTITAAKTFTGLVTFSTVDINGGTIDGTDIGQTVVGDGSFNVLIGDQIQSHTDVIIGTSLAGADPQTGTAIFRTGTNNFLVILTPAVPTATRTQTLPDKNGYVSVVASATGLPSLAEVSGIFKGQATLVAGTVAVAITGAITTSAAVITPLTDATGRLRASCAAGILTIASSDGADTRTVSYIVAI